METPKEVDKRLQNDYFNDSPNNPLFIGDFRSKVFDRAPVHFRDERTIDATMLESQSKIHERTERI